VPSIHLTTRSGAPEETAADTRVVPLFEGEALSDSGLQRLVELGEAKPGLKKVALAHEDAPGGGQRRVLIAGFGKRDELDAERARVAAAAVAARAGELGTVSLSWDAPAGDGVATGLVEGTLLKRYSFDRFKSSRDNGDDGIESLELTGADADEAERARVGAEATNAARDLQNLPSNYATPTFLAERAGELADEHESLEVELLDRDAIVSRGMGAFAAVAQGTEAEPRLIVLRHRPADARGPHLAYVGKAVTFDTGGISIKPSPKMQEMKFDMSGGAAVIEATGAIARLGLPVTLTAVVPSTENMPSGTAVKPGDIVTAMNGKTIEVNNTDAEGRRGAVRARPHLRGAVVERRRLVRAGPRRERRHRRAGLADAAPPRVLRADQGHRRRPAERLRAARCAVQLRGRVPAPVRGRATLDPRRHRRHGVGHDAQLRRQGRQRIRHADADRAGPPGLLLTRSTEPVLHSFTGGSATFHAV
jgi:leucyl aminopeptidase